MKKVGIATPIFWSVAALAGVGNVLLQVRRAHINGSWYGNEGTTVIWGLYTLLALVNAILWTIRYKNGKKQGETEE